jgi:hypothetical protein
MGGKVKIGAVGKIKGSGISPEAFFHPTNSTAHNRQKMSQATGTCKHSRQSEMQTRRDIIVVGFPNCWITSMEVLAAIRRQDCDSTSGTDNLRLKIYEGKASRFMH